MSLATDTLVKRAALIVGMAASLAACGGGGGDSGNGGGSVPTTPVNPPVSTPFDRFGAQFALIARTTLNGEPKDPTAGDVPPLSLTTDPIEPN